MKHYYEFTRDEIVDVLQTESKIRTASLGAFVRLGENDEVCGVCAVGSLLMRAGVQGQSLHSKGFEVCGDVCGFLSFDKVENQIKEDRWMAALSVTFEHFSHKNGIETAIDKCVELVKNRFPETIRISL